MSVNIDGLPSSRHHSVHDHPFREVEEKYHIDEDGQAGLAARIDRIIEYLKYEIRKELKIKEGAEKIRRVTTDKSNSQQARTEVKKSNSRLLELQKDLGDLNNYRLYVVGDAASKNEPSPTIPPRRVHPESGSNQPENDPDPHAERLALLQKQFDREMKVKQGAENLIQTLGGSANTKDRQKLCQEAETMLRESKSRMEYVRMQILRANATNEMQQGNGDRKFFGLETSLENRIEELRHRLRVEAAVCDGAKNVIKLLASGKNPDKKALQEAQNTLNESLHKLDLFRLSLERRGAEVRGRPLGALLEKELMIFSPASNFNYTLSDGRHSVYAFSDVQGYATDILPPCVSKPVPISGTLRVRVVGCQNLLEDVPGRVKPVTSLKSRGSLKLNGGRTYSVRDDKDLISKQDCVNIMCPVCVCCY